MISRDYCSRGLRERSPRDSLRRSQKTIYRQDLQDLHKFLSFSFHHAYPVNPVYFKLIIDELLIDSFSLSHRDAFSVFSFDCAQDSVVG